MLCVFLFLILKNVCLLWLFLNVRIMRNFTLIKITTMCNVLVVKIRMGYKYFRVIKIHQNWENLLLLILSLSRLIISTFTHSPFGYFSRIFLRKLKLYISISSRKSSKGFSKLYRPTRWKHGCCLYLWKFK